MPASQRSSQENATVFNPNALKLVQVATYDRLIDAPLNRAWENVLDWAHLPHLHATSFDYVELQDAGEWGWRTWSNQAHTDHVELTIVDDEKYVARSYQSGHQVSEIWTTLNAETEQTKVHVAFHFPNIDTASIESVGAAILALYTTLWDEDEAMMRRRHFRLLEARDNASEVDLGSETALRQQLARQEKVLFQLRKREYQLRELNGDLIAHASICPHLLGPLEDVDLATGTLKCPWHGYEFDLESGACTFPKDAECTLPPSPEITTIDDRIIARA